MDRWMYRRSLFTVLIVLTLGLPAAGQTSFEVQTFPYQVVIEASWVTDCFQEWRQEQVGDRLRLIGVRSCACGPGVPIEEQETAFFGRLLPGKYTAELLFVFGATGGPEDPCDFEPRLSEDQSLLVTGTGLIKSVEFDPPQPIEGEEVSLKITHEPLVTFPVVTGPQDSTVWVDLFPSIADPPLATEETTVNLGSLAAGDYSLVLTNSSGEVVETATLDAVIPFTVVPQNPTVASLLDGRFRVTVHWQTEDGTEGDAVAIPNSDNAALFWFFDEANTEMLVKVLDTCDFSNFRWFFAAGLTNVGVEITVEDTLTGAEQRYENPLGQPFQPVQDTRAFDCP